jgi:signal peptidase II
MLKHKLTKILVILFLIVINVGCDQIAKSIVRRNVEYNQQTEVFGGFITLTRAENTGAFLSMGDNLPRLLYTIMMIILPLIVMVYALYYLVASEKLSKLFTLGICLFIGGGLGNVYDRIVYGSVTDFLHFDFVLFHTGIVNMADISITAGFLIILFEMIVNRKNLHLKMSD